MSNKGLWIDEEAKAADPLICAFALHAGRFCMRPADHWKTDGRVTRHDSTGYDEWLAKQRSRDGGSDD